MRYVPTEEEIQAEGRRIRSEWNRLLSEKIDQTLLDEIRNDKSKLLRNTTLNIIYSLKHIPEPKGGKRGQPPTKNIITMQAWMLANIRQLNRPDLPMSSTGASILSFLSEEIVILDGKRICWSKHNWKRILDNAKRLIKHHEELEQATTTLISNIKTSKSLYRINKFGEKTIDRNYRKEVRRKIKKIKESAFNRIQNKEDQIKAEEFIDNWVSSWLK